MNSDRRGRERGVAGHRHGPGAVTAEEAPGPVDQARLGQLPEVARVARVPEREERHVRLAVIADLEAQLGRRRRVALLELTRAGERQVVEVDTLETSQPARRGRVERQQQLRLAGRGGAVELGRRLAGERAHQERAGALVGDDGHGRAPALGLVEPGNHLGRGLDVREAREQLRDELAHPRVRRDAPVLAAPVEPALRQPLDRLVEVLVEREVEYELAALAGILVAQPDPGL